MRWFGKKFKCEECGSKFKTEAELADHIKTHKTATTENSGSEFFPCDTCMEKFETRGALQEHIKQFH